jgi:riboflavin synthase
MMAAMFTGLVEELGTVQAVKAVGLGLRLAVKAAVVGKDAALGDSIAVNGCCLTVVKKERGLLTFDAGEETLSRTNFSRLEKGSRVNLERSLAMGERLGGHLVTGHIDSTATLIKRRDDGEWSSLTFRVPSRTARQMASKGSVAVDGVSLTLVSVDGDRFSVAIIPHTLKNTTLGDMRVGDVVNIETDLLAKYVERQLESRKPESVLL